MTEKSAVSRLVLYLGRIFERKETNCFCNLFQNLSFYVSRCAGVCVKVTLSPIHLEKPFPGKSKPGHPDGVLK